VPARMGANGNFCDAGLERCIQLVKMRDEPESRCWPGVDPDYHTS